MQIYHLLNPVLRLINLFSERFLGNILGPSAKYCKQVNHAATVAYGFNLSDVGNNKGSVNTFRHLASQRKSTSVST